MASLILKSNGTIAAGVFHRRVMFGRKPFNALQFDSRAISRIHAWIDQEGDSFYIADAHSRAGTTLNGERITGKAQLHDGDVIRISHEEITYRNSDELPADSLVFDISDDGSNPGYMHNGILHQCSCGAPLWVPASMAGAYGRCSVCKGDITIPGTPLNGTRRPLSPNDSLADMPAINELGSTEKPEDPLAVELHHHDLPTTDHLIPTFPRPKPTAVATQRCKVCHNQVLPKEPTHSCPACGQAHHAECWDKNGGCASYGCTHSAQSEPETQHVRTWQEHEPATATARAARPAAPVTTPFTWDIALLGGTLCGLVLGAFTFGVPSLAVGTASTVFAIKRKDSVGRVAALSAAISVIGVAIGVIISSLLWFSRPWWAR